MAQLWPILFDRYKLDIAFAHRTFAWGSDARGKARVHVVIIGLTKRDDAPREKRLFSYDHPKGEPHESQHTALSPYLFDASGLANPRIVVKSEHRPINGLPRLITGSKPIDGGHYIFDADERDAFLAEEPDAEPYLRPFVGSREFLQGGKRWILRLTDAPPQVLKTLPQVRERIAAVCAYRLASKSKPTQALAATPTLYHVNVIPTDPFLVVPQVSSERRDYIPIGWLEPPVIPSDKLRLLPDATLWQFGLLTSAMHMAWMRTVTGRMKSDYMYSVGVVYNTFPLPPVPAEDYNVSRPMPKPYSPPALPTPTQLLQTSMTPTSCQSISARHTRPSTVRLIACTAVPHSPPTASASNTSSPYTKK